MTEKSNDQRLEVSIKKILMLQILFSVVTLIVIALGYFVAGANEVLLGHQSVLFEKLKAVCFGSCLGIVNTILSARSVKRSSKAVISTPHLAMIPIYAGLLNKLIIVGGGIAIGLIVLGLSPLYVVVGYFVVQIAFVVASLKSPN